MITITKNLIEVFMIFLSYKEACSTSLAGGPSLEQKGEKEKEKGGDTAIISFEDEKEENDKLLKQEKKFNSECANSFKMA
jgi:hypothetical protein